MTSETTRIKCPACGRMAAQLTCHGPGGAVIGYVRRDGISIYRCRFMDCDIEDFRVDAKGRVASSTLDAGKVRRSLDDWANRWLPRGAK